jgi:hypothetical protein
MASRHIRVPAAIVEVGRLDALTGADRNGFGSFSRQRGDTSWFHIPIAGG